MIKSLLYYYWLILGFFKKHTKLFVLAIVIGLFSAFLFPVLSQYLPKIKKHEKIAVVGRPSISDIPLFIQKQISLGLTEITPSDETSTSIATSYSSEDDGKRYIFELRDDLYWHDGKKFSAEDINYNFSDVEITVESPTKVIFNLKEPFAPFPSIVSQPLFRQKKREIFRKSVSLIGLGEMKVDKILRNGQQITELILSSSALKISYKFYNTQKSAILAFKLGEIDKVLELSSPGELTNWPNTTITEVVHPRRYVALFFNTEDDSLSSKSFRQALSYAISIKPNDETRAINPINSQSWAFNPQVKRYDFDLESAKRLLNSEMEGRENFSPKIEITTTLPYLQIAEKIKEEWNNLGIETTIKVTSYLPKEFQTLLIAQEIPPDPDQYSFWHSTQSTNITKYNSPKVDKLLEDGRKTLDKKARTLIYHDFQRFLVEDCPAAFLYNHKTYTISRS